MAVVASYRSPYDEWMSTQSEGYFKSFDQSQIFFQSWEKPKPQGHVIITPGQGEHSECYHRLVQYFEKDPWNFYGWDTRGHGRSDGKRGYVAHFNDYLKDYQMFLDLILPKIDGPVVLLAHSMGALIQLKFLAEIYTPEKYPKIKAQVCSSPLLDVALPVPKVKDAGAQFLARFLPKVTLWNEISNRMLTRDLDVIREFEVDPLRHDVLSAQVYLGFKENFAALPDKAANIKLPTLFQIAEKDEVVSAQASIQFFDRISSPQKRILIYGDGATHEIYNDIIRQQVYQDLHPFLSGIFKEHAL